MHSQARARMVFLLTVLLGAAGVVLAGWLTDERAGLYLGIVIGSGAVVLPALGAVLAPVMPLIGGLMGSEVTSKESRSWFFTLRRRNPITWGLVFGPWLGSAVLAMLVHLVINPRESQTRETMTELQVRIEVIEHETGRLPRIGEEGLLAEHLLGGEGNAVIKDAFGAPIRFSVVENGYQLRSRGFDGKPGTGDDVCLERVRASALRRWLSSFGEASTDREDRFVSRRCDR